MKTITSILITLCMIGSLQAKIDLVTLPDRNITQMTIYNSADLTLIRDGRSLTLKEGENRLQFSWAGTLIDPTSLSMTPKAHIGQIDITDLSFPPRVQNAGIWNIKSEIDGSVPFEISYLTSGLSWRAFYMGTLSEDETTMRLQGYVRITNNSGEDYENAQTRLVVGKVHLLDEIAELANRQQPYGRPDEPVLRKAKPAVRRGQLIKTEMTMAYDAIRKPKGIVKEGLSEYFLYTIEGTETIPDGHSKRLPSFDVDDVPVVNLYKQTDNGFVYRYLSYKNDTDHQLGQTPIPGGELKVYRTADTDGHLSYTGQSSFKYIPVGEDIELNLGRVSDVIVESKVMDTKTDNYRFNDNGNISGWDEIRTIRLTAKNTRSIDVKIELKRNLHTQYWDIENLADAEKYYEKVDMDTIKYTLTLKPASEMVVEYVQTTYNGSRIEDWTKTHR